MKIGLDVTTEAQEDTMMIMVRIPDVSNVMSFVFMFEEKKFNLIGLESEEEIVVSGSFFKSWEPLRLAIKKYSAFCAKYKHLSDINEIEMEKDYIYHTFNEQQFFNDAMKFSKTRRFLLNEIFSVEVLRTEYKYLENEVLVEY